MLKLAKFGLRREAKTINLVNTSHAIAEHSVINLRIGRSGCFLKENVATTKMTLTDQTSFHLDF